jgi:protoheme IX farnesyltransferase
MWRMSKVMATSIGFAKPINSYRERLMAYLEVTKPTITFMVLISVFLGYFLGSFSVSQSFDYFVFLHLIIGSTFASAGVGALNEFVEYESDSKMKRTKNRPIPSGKLTPQSVLFLGLAISIFGIIYHAIMVSTLVSLLSLFTVASYILIYTPLKKRTEWNTLIGAVPGALPPLGGWAAATGSLELGAWIVAGILFLWQLPHFLAIAWIYRKDYQRGGFRMLTVVDPSGKRLARHLLVSSLALLILSIIPSLINLTGMVYLTGVGIMGVLLLWFSIRTAFLMTNIEAHRLLLASIAYLPVLLGVILLDNLIF